MALIREVRGYTPEIGNDTWLAENATVIGNVKIGENCSIWYNAVLRGDVNAITIGNNTNIQDGVVTQPDAQSYQQSTNIFFELNPTEIPAQNENKVVTANYILRDAKETNLDQQYAKQRFGELMKIASSVKLGVVIMGIIAILASWGIVIAQNQWVKSEIRRRL